LAATELIDAPFNRPQQGRVRSDPLTFTPKDRAEQIQLIVDLRRAIDVLEARPDVKTDQLAYFGVSYGAAMGGLLAGVEDRIRAYVLAVGDGGLVSHFAGPDDTDGPLQALPAQQRERWLQAMRPIEPLNFIGQAAPAALLFLAGTKDESVPPEDARRFYQAASQPKEVRWYEAGHFLDCTARKDMMAWLARHISHWTDEASNVSRLDPSGAVQVDAERPSHDRKVAAISSASLTRRPFAVCWWGPGARHPSLGVAWPWVWRPAAQRIAPTPRDFRAGNAELRCC
jgi:dienelactone hydrolase